MTASKELLECLHQAVGEQLLAKIQSGEATASDYAQAIKFLKDNHIEVLPGEDNPIGDLATSLAERVPFTSVNDQTSH